MPGELGGGHTDAARGRVDEDRLTGAQAPEVAQPVQRGQEHHRDRCRLGERPTGGHGGQQAVVGDGERTEGTVEQAHHAVTRGQGRHPWSDLDDHSGRLGADHGPAGVHAERDQRVAEVHPCRVDRDPDLPVGQRPGRARVVDDGESVQGVPRAGLDPPGCGPVQRDQGRTGGGPYQARCQDGTVPDHRLGLTGGHDGAQQLHREGRVGVLRIEIDEDEPVRVLGLRGSHQTPDRGVDRAGHVGGGIGADRATREDDQAGSVEALLGEPGAHDGEDVVDGGGDQAGRGAVDGRAEQEGGVGTGQGGRAGVRVERERRGIGCRSRARFAEQRPPRAVGPGPGQRRRRPLHPVQPGLVGRRRAREARGGQRAQHE